MFKCTCRNVSVQVQVWKCQCVSVSVEVSVFKGFSGRTLRNAFGKKVPDPGIRCYQASVGQASQGNALDPLRFHPPHLHLARHLPGLNLENFSQPRASPRHFLRPTSPCGNLNQRPALQGARPAHLKTAPSSVLVTSSDARSP